MSKSVTVLAWNVAHQIYERSIPTELGLALAHVGTDVVFLTEFVDGPSRGAFRDQLHSAGYLYQGITAAPPKHNHVFVASRLPFIPGEIQPPAMDAFASSNFLHVRLCDSGIELIGIRAPSYRGAERNAYRRELAAVLRSAAIDRALVVTGDINEDPFKGEDKLVLSATFRDADVYCVPRPEGAWSFTSWNGASTSRIDHVLHTARIQVRDVRYVYDVEGIRLAGPRSVRPLSDHAAITFTAELANDGLC